MERKPHKHAAVIHAFADGAEIQGRFDSYSQWGDMDNPSFLPDWQYRVKPAPVTVAVECWAVILNHGLGGCIYKTEASARREWPSAKHYIKLTGTYEE